MFIFYNFCFIIYIYISRLEVTSMIRFVQVSVLFICIYIDGYKIKGAQFTTCLKTNDESIEEIYKRDVH